MLADLDEQQQLQNSLPAVRPEQDLAAWKQHGPLLSSTDRLKMENATAPASPGWSPTWTSSEPATTDLRAPAPSVSAATLCCCHDDGSLSSVITTVRANGVTLGVEHFGGAAAPLVLCAGGTTMPWP